MGQRPDFEAYVSARSPALVQTAYLLCRDHGLAEDLVQAALTKAWLAWSRIGENPDPYVFRIVTNTHASWYRRRWRGEVPTETLPERPAASADEVEGRAGDRATLWRALGKLNERERAAIVLRYFLDLDHAQIADILRCPPGTVRSQISRALAKLRVDPAVPGVAPDRS